MLTYCWEQEKKEKSTMLIWPLCLSRRRFECGSITDGMMYNLQSPLLCWLHCFRPLRWIFVCYIVTSNNINIEFLKYIMYHNISRSAPVYLSLSCFPRRWIWVTMCSKNTIIQSVPVSFSIIRHFPILEVCSLYTVHSIHSIYLPVINVVVLAIDISLSQPSLGCRRYSRW